MAVRYALVRRKAAELLALGKVTSAPVDVVQLATQVLGATVKRAPFDGKLSGLVHRGRDGRAVIGVNDSHAPVRQRFTIAHELGHLLLHAQEDLHVDEGIWLRNERSSSAEDEREIEANQFAAELLMPAELIRDAVAGRELDLANDDDPMLKALAEMFQVSRQALSIRLSRLC
jgi:Zn-dependent peptidase ImmA (M78 family)